ncbi:MAG: apolipoprotein N-acyltransferase [Thermodesulfovibrionales bacterium]
MVRGLKKIILPVISGALLVLSFPQPGISILAWIALIPLLFEITKRDLTKKETFIKGFSFGMVYFFGTLYWIYHSVHFYGGLSLIPSIMVVLLLAAYLSIYTGLFTYLISLIHRKTLYPMILIAPAIWVSLEYIRTYLFTGFPWSSIGYSQYKFLSLIQIADITGIYGISFLIVAFNAAFLDIILLKKRLSEIPFYPLAPQVTGFLLLIMAFIATFSYGYWRLSQQQGNMVKISIIQGNIPQDKKWEPAFQQEVMNIYKELTRKVVNTDSPQLVVWPETAIPFLFSEPAVSSSPPGIEQQNINEIMSKDLIEFVRAINTYLLFGSIRKETEDRQEFFTNSAFLLNKDGKVTYIYDKIHLVPFGEYVPLRSILFFIDKITVGIGDYRPGRDTKRAISPFGNFSTLICYEIIFPGLVRESLREGGDFIVNITNDAWFGNTSGPYQHFSMAVFRAIENRKPVIRAANTGISGFIDSNGRIQVATPLFKRMAISMNIRLDNRRTFYTRFGDLFVYFCLVVSIITLSRTFKFA